MFINLLVVNTLANRPKNYDVKMGLVGSVVKSKRSVIVTDAGSSSDYNRLVDLVSLMPVYITPIYKIHEYYLLLIHFLI